MSTDAQEVHWFVGKPVGSSTRVQYQDPTGAHPLTPASIRERYKTEVRRSALVFWLLPMVGLAGLRAGIDEVAWRDCNIEYFETMFCRPAKGSGYIWLTAYRSDGGTLALLASDAYDAAIHDYHKTVASWLEQVYPGLSRTVDNGYDA